MLGILRLAVGSLFLILTVLFFTVSAQQTNDSLKEDLQSETAFAESTRTVIEKESFIKREARFFTPAENRLISPKSVETGADEPQASTERSVYRARRGAREYNFEIGVSPFEPTNFNGRKEFNTAGRKFGTIDFRIGRVLGTSKGITYTYFFGFSPLVVALKNEVRNPAYISPAATPNVYRTRRETSYAFGFTPANFRFTFFPGSRIKPYVQGGAGVLFFNKPIPIPESRRMQFMGDLGGGFIVHLKNPKQFLSFGYRYFHISNGNIGGKRWNPGYNANIFYIGFSFFK
ncbi:MAG TPA: acyloxyacyl hydrolase [Pyrinomonadaceae bacterium]